MYLFMFSFTILGMELYSHTLRFDNDNKPIEFFKEVPKDLNSKYSVPFNNFNGFLNATVAVFIVFTNDGWNSIYLNHYRVNGMGAFVFFVSIAVIG